MIQTRIEGKRGCGYRKPGAIYLVGPPLSAPCCRLPLPLTVCPCCSAGIKPTRGWTWVDAGQLFGEAPCKDRPRCPLSEPEAIGRAGLLWVGEQFYPTPGEFLAEAGRMGVSRLIHTVPKEFKLGETWVLLAHRKGLPSLSKSEGELVETTKWGPAIFSVFRPTALEYVVKGTETEEELEKLARRGLTPVRVEHRRAAA